MSPSLRRGRVTNNNNRERRCKERTSCRTLQILKNVIKVVQRIFEEKCQNIVEIDNIQMGLSARDTVAAIFAVRPLVEKAFDRVAREIDGH